MWYYTEKQMKVGLNVEQVLVNAFAYVLIIAGGYGLKRFGVFQVNDFRVLAKIVLNLTLPAAVIVNFNKIALDTSLLALVAMGFVCTLVHIGAGYGLGRRHGVIAQAFNMQNFSGYNIGVFALPFILNFIGPVGVAAICLFDVGNSLLVMGGTYALASSVLHEGRRNGVWHFVKTILSSTTMVVYLIMTALSLLHVKVPAEPMVLVSKVAMANGFLAMLMIGIGFELHLARNQVARVVQALAVRVGFAVIVALGAYYVLPFALEVRQALVVLAFAPIPASATAFTAKLDGDIALSSTLNSLAILVSILIMTLLLINMHLI
jgi:predicted permease